MNEMDRLNNSEGTKLDKLKSAVLAFSLTFLVFLLLPLSNLLTQQPAETVVVSRPIHLVNLQASPDTERTPAQKEIVPTPAEVPAAVVPKLQSELPKKTALNPVLNFQAPLQLPSLPLVSKMDLQVQVQQPPEAEAVPEAASDNRLTSTNSGAEVASLPDKEVYEFAEVDREPKIMLQVPPLFPELAKRRNIEGQVTVEFVIDVNGEPQNIQILQADPEQIFNSAVVNAVRQWRFEAALKNDSKVPVRAETTLRFQLED